MHNKYQALRVVAVLHKLIGVVFFGVGLLGILLLLALAVRHGTSEVFSFASGMRFAGTVALTVVGLGSFAFGELLYLFMDIEANTRVRRPGAEAVNQDFISPSIPAAPAPLPVPPTPVPTPVQPQKVPATSPPTPAFPAKPRPPKEAFYNIVGERLNSTEDE
jgi:hypothetical protein